MENYLETALVLLPLLGVTVFDVVAARPTTDVPATADAARSDATGTAPDAHSVAYFLRAPLTDASGQDESRGFLVRQGALGRSETKTMDPGYELKRTRLQIEGVLVPHNADQFILTRDYLFDSPSQAASVLTGGSKNGRRSWQDATGRTLKENQEAEAART